MRISDWSSDVCSSDLLRLATPVGSEIAKGLDGLFRVRGEGILPDDPEARLLTRSLEGSNVTATSALVEMIEASRSWDTQLKMINDVRDMDSATANLLQLPRSGEYEMTIGALHVARHGLDAQ